MQKKNDLILFSATLFLAFLSKGGALLHGYSVDDYAFSTPYRDTIQLFLQHGRYIPALLDYLFVTLNVYATDLSLFFGSICLILQSALIVSILRFFKLNEKPYSFMLSALWITHPYTAEILSFKTALPMLSISLFLCITIIELINITFSNRLEINKLKLLALAATCSIILSFTYQIYLNILITIAAISLFIFFLERQEGHLDSANSYLKKFLSLLLMCLFSGLFSLFVLQLAAELFEIKITNRSNILKIEEIPTRIFQAYEILVKIYYKSEPILDNFSKLILLFITILLFGITIKRSCNLRKNGFITGLLLPFFISVAIMLTSIGLISILSNWWPMPRVLFHFILVPIALIGFGFPYLKSNFAKKIIIFSGFFVAFLQALASNQIFSDQIRIARWDSMLANRIVSAIEREPNFNGIMHIYIDEGNYSYPMPTQTLQGDMNISARSTYWSKIRLLEESTGYLFLHPSHEQATYGKKHCSESRGWPDRNSVVVDKDLIIVCY